MTTSSPTAGITGTLTSSPTGQSTEPPSTLSTTSPTQEPTTNSTDGRVRRLEGSDRWHAQRLYLALREERHFGNHRRAKQSLITTVRGFEFHGLERPQADTPSAPVVEVSGGGQEGLASDSDLRQLLLQMQIAQQKQTEQLKELQKQSEENAARFDETEAHFEAFGSSFEIFVLVATLAVGAIVYTALRWSMTSTKPE